MRYKNVFVGGTFDGLHAGHVAVLTRAFEVGQRVTIGATSDGFIRRYKSKILNPKSQTNPKFKIQKRTKSFKARKRYILSWLEDKKLMNLGTVISIDDPYEPAASGDFDALIVTKDNRDTGKELNRRRRQKGLSELALIEVPLVSAQDHTPISTTRVRNGEIDGNGRLVMPQSLIPALRKPLGSILKDKDLRFKIKDLKNKIIIAVGDQTTKTLLNQGVMPDLSIIDRKVGRKPFHDAINMLQPEKVSPFQAIAVKSGPGFMSKKAIQAVKATLERLVRPTRQATRATQARREKHVIVVEGEEDLLALPAIIFAPLRSLVLYGQPASPNASQGGPGKGMVKVIVTKRSKLIAQKLQDQFTLQL